MTSSLVDNKTNNPRQKRAFRYDSYITRVCEILDIDLPPDTKRPKDWKIVDKKDDYVLVHYVEHPYCDLDTFGHLRGIILDLSTGEIVRQSYGYMPDCVHEYLKLEEDGSVKILPFNKTKKLHIKKPSFTVGRDGVIIDLWMDKNGKIRKSSLKKIDIDENGSRCPGSLEYATIYSQQQLPDPKLLFSENKLSPFVHSFLMCHPDLANVSKEPMGSGYGVYLGCKKMNVPSLANHGAVEEEPVDITKAVDNTSKKIIEVMDSTEKREGVQNKKLIYITQNISIKSVNRHLRYGFYDSWDDELTNPYLRTGEFVIVKDEETGSLYRVLSPAYHWRSKIRFSKHIPHCFHILAHDANLNTTKKIDYFDNGTYPHLTRENIAEIRSVIEKGNPVLRLVGKEKLDLTKYEDRLFNIWLCLLLAVPIHQQINVINCIENYEQNLKKGAENAIKIYKADDKDYNEDIFDLSAQLSYVPLEKKVDQSLRRKKAIEKLRKMRPEDSYSVIRKLQREVERVERLKKKNEN